MPIPRALIKGGADHHDRDDFDTLNAKAASPRSDVFRDRRAAGMDLGDDHRSFSD
jgi:hypothetical protein